MSDIQIGLMLLAIGFPTVFLILWMVIILGKGLILAVNKYAPEEEPIKAIPAVVPIPAREQHISSSRITAIISAVNLATGGKGKVTKIEKL
jgi:oxaloacetate decarboxylase gamma subunit